MYNIESSIEKNNNQINYLSQIDELKRELQDFKDKNKIITNKF